jgi:hypothetical protein
MGHREAGGVAGQDCSSEYTSLPHKLPLYSDLLDADGSDIDFTIEN